MATLPLALPPQTDPLPEYLPARMVNEFVYCPRLFFYEWVEGVFQESADTIEGSTQHRRVDKEGGALPAAEDLDEDLKTQAITLSSERLKVIAKMDIVQVENGRVRPLDYKKGSPKEGADGPEMWPADRVQVVLQALVLRENGYVCDEAVVYYRGTNQKVRVPLTDAVIEEATAAVYGAWRTSESSLIPTPLVDSPKCPGCSLNSICLPDETNALAYGELEEDDDSQLRLFAVGFPQRKPAKRELRRLIVPREDRKPLYLSTQGLKVGKSGEVLQVKEKDAVRQHSDHDAGDSSVVRGRNSDFVFLTGRVVLRHHIGVEHEECVLAARAVPVGDGGMVRTPAGAEVGSGEDSQSTGDGDAES